MIVHQLCGSPPAELARALSAFETQFIYPLGPGRSFRISHGEDYPRFFRAIGDAACFVVEHRGEVRGTLGAAVRNLALADGSARSVIYFGDLKVAPTARGGTTLLRLTYAVRDWIEDRVDAAFAVVMDGTAVTPPRYTGRLGIPSFRELGKVVVLRLLIAEDHADADERFTTTAALAEACYRRLSEGRYASRGGKPAERSEMEPLWLMHPDGSSCGRLEDTRRAKRLFASDDTEMRAAHLSSFAYQDRQAGVELLRQALRRAAALAFPALFVAVSVAEAENICRALEGIESVAAPATVFGVGLEPFPFWHINTAEI